MIGQAGEGAAVNTGQQRRMQIAIQGAVQGVGFRPFVYRLAVELGVNGWVNNDGRGVFIEAEGTPDQLDAFLRRLEQDKPAPSFIQTLDAVFLEPVGFRAFQILSSDENGAKTALILPDLATCPSCVREVFDPADRRFRYPFTNCTHCGPRFSIIEALPYDRPHTTMAHFTMCAACRAEYENPLDRRFHAQPNACPACGPHLELWDADGRALCSDDDALRAAADAIRDGQIVALKGLGGFQLLVDARSEAAVCRLRERKRREAKPLAVMFPSLEQMLAHCDISPVEEELLLSQAAPIVLIKRRSDSPIAPQVAFSSPNLGVMLPYTPLHHLLMRDLNFPIVATSGNLSDEVICTDEQDALRRLNGAADVFLVHNRPIAHHVDDSVMRAAAGRITPLRRARGYAPLPLRVPRPLPPILAVGAHLKNTIAISVNDQIFLSQHIGDLETAQTYDAFCRVIEDFERLYDFQPQAVACDLHTDYLSTQYAASLGLPLIRAQHHYAHVLSCMAEHDLDAPLLGVAWDGTGLGTDGASIWGGEFLRVDDESFTRAAHLRPFRLPGGEAAIKEPRRSALGLLYALFGDAAFDEAESPLAGAFSPSEQAALHTMLKQGINAPLTSSAGRLFDAVSALIGIRTRCSFEGQAAMELEFAAGSAERGEAYDFALLDGEPLVIDWEPMIRGILDDRRRAVPPTMIAAKFHHTLADMIAAAAKHMGLERVVLTGGCFQNRLLLEQAAARLREAGLRPYWHERIPCNDGGIAIGQIMAAARVLRNGG